jgi:hypothetical protein
MKSSKSSVVSLTKGIGILGPVDPNLRLLTGSESLLREIMFQVPRIKGTDDMDMKRRTHSISGTSGLNIHYSQGEGSNQGDRTQQHEQNSEKDEDTISRVSVFDRKSFQDFTCKKLTELAEKNDYSCLIEMREKALKFKEQTEK